MCIFRSRFRQPGSLSLDNVCLAAHAPPPARRAGRGGARCQLVGGAGGRACRRRRREVGRCPLTQPQCRRASARTPAPILRLPLCQWSGPGRTLGGGLDRRRRRRPGWQGYRVCARAELGRPRTLGAAPLPRPLASSDERPGGPGAAPVARPGEGTGPGSVGQQVVRCPGTSAGSELGRFGFISTRLL